MFFYRNPLKWVDKQRIEGGIAGDTLGSFGLLATSLSGDGEILLIGSPLDSTDEIDAGSVRVYREIDGTYQQVQELTASTDQSREGSRLGMPSKITRDKNLLFIGAINSNDKSQDAGSVYVFQSSSIGYQQVQTITASGDGDPAGDQFSLVLDFSDDNNTLIISSRYSDENGTSAGSVYVFRSGSEGYYEAQKLTASGADIDPAKDYFGHSLSISGDAQIIAVGAFGEQNLNGDPGDGAVYIFESGSSGYSQIQKIEGYGRIYTNGPYSWFGFDMKMTSDGQKLVVAARYDDLPEQEKIGTVSVFRRTGNQYVLEQKLEGNYNNVIQNISSVAINQDASLIFAGSSQYETGFADYTDHGNPNEGAIFVFQSGSSGYELKQTITKNVPLTGLYLADFGNSIAVNDEGTTFVSSQPKESDVDQGTPIGAAYVFKLTRDY